MRILRALKAPKNIKSRNKFTESYSRSKKETWAGQQIFDDTQLHYEAEKSRNEASRYVPNRKDTPVNKPALIGTPFQIKKAFNFRRIHGFQSF